MKRRSFLKRAVAVPAIGAAASVSGQALPQASGSNNAVSLKQGSYSPGRIPNEYSLYLPGEREALAHSPRVVSISGDTVNAILSGQAESMALKVGDAIGGWQLVAILGWLNGTATAVFEKHVTHQGAIAYVTEMGEIAHIPKRIGDLSKIRPRPTNNPHGVKLERPARYVPGLMFAAITFSIQKKTPVTKMSRRSAKS